MIIEDEKLLNISIIITFIGLIILSIMSYYQKIPLYNIEQISKDKIGERITVNGQVETILEYNIDKFDENKNNQSSSKFNIVSIKDECYIDIILDGENNISKYSNISVTGIVENYKENIQIRAEKISVIKK